MTRRPNCAPTGPLWNGSPRGPRPGPTTVSPSCSPPGERVWSAPGTGAPSPTSPTSRTSAGSPSLSLCIRDRALWCTYHPGQTPYDRFLAKCRDLADRGVRHSVGVVGLPEHFEAARRLRADLPAHVYLWVNAAEGHTYSDEEADRWTGLDPLFPFSRRPHRSAGLPCRTGESVVSVDGEGTVRRCHFVRAELGNLYDGSYRAALRPRSCPLSVCDCHIGYVHLETLPLYDVFAGGVLERIPATLPAPRPRPGTVRGRPA